MSHQDVIKRMADAGSEFARELLRRKMERLKPVKTIEFKPEPKPEIRSDEEIESDPNTSVEDFFAAAERICKKLERVQNECK